MSKKPPLTSEDASLWHSFVRGIIPMNHEKKVSIKKKSEAYVVIPSPTSGNMRRGTVTLSLETNGKATPEGKRIKNRRDPSKVYIDATLDLHGLTEDKAYERLKNFLTHRQQRSAQWVLIVTGKSGILFEMTPKWLGAMPGLVTSHCHAKPAHGGKGALYVKIQKAQD